MTIKQKLLHTLSQYPQRQSVSQARAAPLFLSWRLNHYGKKWFPYAEGTPAKQCPACPVWGLGLGVGGRVAFFLTKSSWNSPVSCVTYFWRRRFVKKAWGELCLFNFFKIFLRFIILIVCVCVWTCVYLNADVLGQRHQISRTGVINCCEQFHMGAGNWPQVLFWGKQYIPLKPFSNASPLS